MQKILWVIMITLIAGVGGTGLGGIIGVILKKDSTKIVSLLLAFAGGAMLYVVFGELLPEAFLMWKSKAPGAMTLVGTLVGLILIRI